MIQQTYIQNTNKAYPLVDNSVLDSFIVDLSITSPVSIEPVITAVTIISNNVFIALEDNNTKTGLGHLQISRVKKYIPYTFTTIIPEIFAWCVFGEIKDTTNIHLANQSIELDPTVMTKIPETIGINNLTLNGNRVDISGNLLINSSSEYLNIYTDVAIVDGIERDCITLSRNDTNISLDVLYNKLKETGDISTRVHSIAGISPDINGNINIQSDPASSSFTDTIILDRSDDTNIGILFNESAELCATACPECEVKHSKCELGISSVDGLPCDSLVTERHPEFIEEDCGCT